MDAASSNLFGWISLAVGVLVAGGALAMNARPVRLDTPPRGIMVSGVVGLLLVANATVLAALGGGRGLWLTGLGGVLCLAVEAGLALRAIGYQLEAATDTLGRRLASVERAVLEIEHRPVKRPEIAAYVAAPVDLSDLGEGFAIQGMWAPVSIYTTAADGTALKDAVVESLRVFGLDVAGEEPVERGSWFQRFWVRERNFESVRTRMRKLEQAVELQYLGKARAEIDQAKAQAAAAILQAIGTHDNAVVRIGSLIVIKAEGDLAVWTVSELEAADMERHSALLRDPVSALEYLRALKRTTTLEPLEDGDSQGTGDG